MVGVRSADPWHGAERARGRAVWQPDVTWTGGLTQLRAIFGLGRELGIPLVAVRR